MVVVFACATLCDMNPTPLYHFRKTRKQRAWLFINMALMCWLYMAGVWFFEPLVGKVMPAVTGLIMLTAFAVASVVLLALAWWLRCHPAVYEAMVTTQRLRIDYPGSQQWSFDVSLADIKRFEHRKTLSHAGSGIARSGVLLRDGTFHPIPMNYGNNINKMYRAVKQVRPQVTFPRRVNTRVEGLLERDYTD